MYDDSLYDYVINIIYMFMRMLTCLNYVWNMFILFRFGMVMRNDLRIIVCGRELRECESYGFNSVDENRRDLYCIFYILNHMSFDVELC